MDKKRNDFLKWEVLILALNFFFTLINGREEFKAFYSFIVIIFIIVLLILKIIIKNEKKQMIINLIIGAIAILFYYMDPSNGAVYFYLAFIDGLHFKNSKFTILENIYVSLTYLISVVLINFSGNDIWTINTGKQIIIQLAPYIGFCAISIMINIRTKDKKRIRDLNMELKEQNKRLIEYSNQVESLTLEKERNRVAQELHDSLGHYLMALSMHLKILEKIKDEEKKEEVFTQTKEIVKDSIEELRETVYKLKEEKNISFIEEVKSLEETFKEEIEFVNNIDAKIENEEKEVKGALVKTVKEAITNGVKHGECTVFKIEIKINEKIIFNISNNGISPKEIKKSNGLLGIEERIKKINGKVDFETKEGFTIKGEIERKTI